MIKTFFDHSSTPFVFSRPPLRLRLQFYLPKLVKVFLPWVNVSSFPVCKLIYFYTYLQTFKTVHQCLITLLIYVNNCKFIVFVSFSFQPVPTGSSSRLHMCRYVNINYRYLNSRCRTNCKCLTTHYYPNYLSNRNT